ncbi:MAG: protein kinase [Cyanobacteria bacterium P01_D01_bin.36]
MIYCLNPACPHPQNPAGNVHCQYCGVPIALRNRFKASRVLGQGGFGKTYLAQDLDNRNKPCVIKRLTYKGADAQANEKARQLFEQEAERLDQLVHPQIPRLLAYFQESNYLYLVQEVIEGQTLHQEFESDGPFNESNLRLLLNGLLPVLQFVHSRNVIHRDIKPDNIMRRRNGELILIDFGVAKFLEQSVFPHAATTIGTPGYAAPEQISGRVTPASDLFALGATCFQLLSGCFDTNEVSTVGYGWVKRWRHHVKSPISDELAAILSKMMAVDDTQRYRSATAVLNDLSASSPSALAQPYPVTPAASQLPTVAAAPNRPPAYKPPAASNPPNAVPKPGSPAANAAISGGPAPASKAPNPYYSVAPASPAPLGFISPPVTSHSPNPSAPTAISFKANQQGHSAGQFPVGSLKTVAVDVLFWLKYGLFSQFGHALGFVVAMIGMLLFTVLTHPNPNNISPTELEAVLRLVYWLHWPVAGFFVGLAQWLAIRRLLPRSLWWLPATVAGFWAIAFAVAIGYANAFSGVVVGVFVGLPQWAAMRKQAPRAGWWVLWTMVFTALLCGAISGSFSKTLGWFLIVPLLDGLFLSWILRQQTQEVTHGQLVK